MMTGPALAQAQRAALAADAKDEVDRARSFSQIMRHRAEVDRLWGTGLESFPEIELAGTARIGQRRACTQLHDARRLVELLPGTLSLLEAGVMFQATAELVLYLTRGCTEQVTVELERRALTRYATAGTSDARRLIEAMIPEIVADLHPELTRRRLADARTDRGVWVNPMPNGMCQVGVSLDVLTGRRWSLDFEELIRAQKVLDPRDGRTRTQAQRRADVFAELPGRLLALIQAIQQGTLGQLLTQAGLSTDELASLRQLAHDTSDLSADISSSQETTTEPAGTEPTTTEPTGTELGDPDNPEYWSQGWHRPPAPTPRPRPPLDMVELAESAAQTRPRTLELTLTCLRLPVGDPRVLDVHIPMTTLLELDNRTGWIEGLGPVPAELTRLLVPVAGLRRVYVDPYSGIPIGLDPHLHPAPVSTAHPANTTDVDAAVPAARSTADASDGARATRRRLLGLLGPAVLTLDAQATHDPHPALRRYLQVRDRHCTGIGCSSKPPGATATTNGAGPTDPPPPGTSAAKAHAATAPNTMAGASPATRLAPPPGPAPSATAAPGPGSGKPHHPSQPPSR